MRNNPIPQGKYVPATRFGSFIFTAGMTARRDGVPILTGRAEKDRPLEFYKEAVCQAASNALSAAQNLLVENEKIAGVLSLSVYIDRVKVCSQKGILQNVIKLPSAALPQ